MDHDERVAELAEQTLLSEREAEVQALLEAGRRREEIAEELDLSRNTIDEYRRRINEKVERARRTVEMLNAE